MSDVDRRGFLSGLAGAAIAGATAAHADGGQLVDERPPNVVFVFSDEHRWQSMSFTEMPGIHTPNMAKLAHEGTSYDQCISNYPVCSPHRAILLTGRWPYQMKMRDDSPGMIDNAYQLSPDQPTLGRAFQDAGYTTGYVGKWHLGDTDPRAEDFGFDLSLIWTHTNDHWDSYYHPAGGEPVHSTVYNATGMTDQALEFIEQNVDQPFLLMLSINPPHSSFTDPPEDMAALYEDDNTPPLPPNATGGDREGFLRQYRGYHAHISAVDAELGRVMDKLDELGIADNTILIYTSDHGSMLTSHGVGSKRQPYQEAIRVPFIVRWPGMVPSDERTDSLLGTIDLMPTVCGLAGVTIPTACSGTDLSRGMLGQGGVEVDTQFIMHISKLKASGGNNHPAPIFRGVTTGRYTYAILPDREDLLFDNEADPHQLDNRIDDPAMADTRAGLHARLRSWLDEADDPFPMGDALNA